MGRVNLPHAGESAGESAACGSIVIVSLDGFQLHRFINDPKASQTAVGLFAALLDKLTVCESRWPLVPCVSLVGALDFNSL
jgi:hypothetical protein